MFLRPNISFLHRIANPTIDRDLSGNPIESQQVFVDLDKVLRSIGLNRNQYNAAKKENNKAILIEFWRALNNTPCEALNYDSCGYGYSAIKKDGRKKFRQFFMVNEGRVLTGRAA